MSKDEEFSDVRMYRAKELKRLVYVFENLETSMTGSLEDIFVLTLVKIIKYHAELQEIRESKTKRNSDK